jgi:hypothetical protein
MAGHMTPVSSELILQERDDAGALAVFPVERNGCEYAQLVFQEGTRIAGCQSSLLLRFIQSDHLEAPFHHQIDYYARSVPKYRIARADSFTTAASITDPQERLRHLLHLVRAACLYAKKEGAEYLYIADLHVSNHVATYVQAAAEANCRMVPHDPQMHGEGVDVEIQLHA